MTAEQAAEQQAADALAERDAIQANLLELDGSYTRRLLDGGPLTGQTRERWDKASATLASLWETYMAYSAVVDRVAELSAGGRRVPKKELPELTELLTGTSVRLTRAPAPLAQPGPGRHGQAGAHARGLGRRDAPGLRGGSRGDLGRRDGLDRGGRPAARGGAGTGTLPGRWSPASVTRPPPRSAMRRPAWARNAPR